MNESFKGISLPKGEITQIPGWSETESGRFFGVVGGPADDVNSAWEGDIQCEHLRETKDQAMADAATLMYQFDTAEENGKITTVSSLPFVINQITYQIGDRWFSTIRATANDQTILGWRRLKSPKQANEILAAESAFQLVSDFLHNVPRD